MQQIHTNTTYILLYHHTHPMSCFSKSQKSGVCGGGRRIVMWLSNLQFYCYFVWLSPITLVLTSILQLYLLSGQIYAYYTHIMIYAHIIACLSMSHDILSVHVCIYIYTCINIYIYMYIYRYICIYICIHIYIYIYAYIYIYTYIYCFSMNIWTEFILPEPRWRSHHIQPVLLG